MQFFCNSIQISRIVNINNATNKKRKKKTLTFMKTSVIIHIFLLIKKNKEH